MTRVFRIQKSLSSTTTTSLSPSRRVFKHDVGLVSVISFMPCAIWLEKGILDYD